MTDPCNHSHGFIFIDWKTSRCSKCGALFVRVIQNGWPTMKEVK